LGINYTYFVLSKEKIGPMMTGFPSLLGRRLPQSGKFMGRSERQPRFGAACVLPFLQPWAAKSLPLQGMDMVKEREY